MIFWQPLDINDLKMHQNTRINVQIHENDTCVKSFFNPWNSDCFPIQFATINMDSPFCVLKGLLANLYHNVFLSMKIYYLFEGGIEKLVLQDHHLSLLEKPRDAKW